MDTQVITLLIWMKVALRLLIFSIVPAYLLWSFLSRPLFTAISSLQSRNLVETCYIEYAFFFFSLLQSCISLSDLNDVGICLLLLFWLWGREEKEGWTCALKMRLCNRNLCAVASLVARHNLSSDCLMKCGENLD